MEMFGAVLKEYYKEKDAEEEKSTISVAIMPCVAKKMELSGKNSNGTASLMSTT